MGEKIDSYRKDKGTTPNFIWVEWVEGDRIIPIIPIINRKN